MLHLTCNIMAQSVIVNFCHRTDNQMHIAYNAISSVLLQLTAAVTRNKQVAHSVTHMHASGLSNR